MLLLRYRDLREAPRASPDRICAHLAVDSGVLTDVPAENVTTHARDSVRNRITSRVLRAGAAVEHQLPPTWWPRIARVLARELQREQRPRHGVTSEQRAELIPRFVDDERLLEHLTRQSFSDWLDPHESRQRPQLQPSGRIGTAHADIDHPLPEGKTRQSQ